MKRTKDDTARTREMVMAAAADVFYENGLSRTTLDQIARRAGLTRGAIYWHFKDKADLVTALHRGVVLPQESVIDAMIDQEADDPIDFIRAGGIDFLKTFEADEHQQRVYAIVTLGCEYFGEARETIARISEANEAMHARLMKLIDKADRRGALKPGMGTDTVARALQCSMNGLLTEWLKSGRGFDLVAVGTLQIDSLLAAVAAKG